MQKLMPILLARGDTVLIDQGVLRIQPASGRAVPEDWLASNRMLLIREILEIIGSEAFEYIEYSTGFYPPHNKGGITLQFISVRGCLPMHSIFNASLTRKRNTATKKAGSALPKNHFRIGKRGGFYKFWMSTGLPIRRLSDLHDYMGKLRPILFGGQHKNGRIASATLAPLSISATEIASAFADTSPTNLRQPSDISPTKAPDKETPDRHISRGLQPDSTACHLNRGNTVIRSYGHTGPSLSSIIQPEDQTITEWLNDYDSAPDLINVR
ncbi:MAG: hypothetical protein V7693_10940 [Halopseudomonas sabulinigri]